MLSAYLRVPVHVAALTAFVFASPARLHAGQPGKAENALPLAYEAVFPGRFHTTSTILYDHGKYAIRGQDGLRLYDGSWPPLRWWVDLRTKTAHLDTFAVLRRLDADIGAQGVSQVARTTGVKPETLERFHRGFGTWTERVLDHLLWKTSAREMASMQPAGTELVAGWRCAVYVDKQAPAPGSRIWVEPSTGLVLRWQYTVPSGNPRIPPVTNSRRVLKFRVMRNLAPSNFILPRGITAELPRLLADLPLPGGVRRRLLSGKDSMLGEASVYLAGMSH